VPRESLDAPKNLSKECQRQVTFGQLQDKVSDVPDEAAADLEEAPLE
jgi:hypothetical protein